MDLILVECYKDYSYTKFWKYDGGTQPTQQSQRGVLFTMIFDVMHLFSSFLVNSVMYFSQCCVKFWDLWIHAEKRIFNFSWINSVM